MLIRKPRFAFPVVLILSMIILSSVTPITHAEQSKRVDDNVTLKMLAKRVELVHPLAWKKTQTAIKSLRTPTSSLIYRIGPDSKRHSKFVKKVYRLTQQVFSEIEFPNRTIMLLTTGNDLDWAEKEFLTLMGEYANPSNIGNGRNGNLEAITIKRIDPNNKALQNDPNVANGGTDAHGFVHVIQWYLLGEGSQNHLGIPRWILEGSADFMGIFYHHKNDYQNWLRNRSAKSMRQHSIKFLNSYLVYVPLSEVPPHESPWFVTNRYPDDWAYDIGAYVCDILVALKGPSSLLQIYEDYPKTKDFDKSFENIYGISWSEARPIISEIIFKLARKSID